MVTRAGNGRKRQRKNVEINNPLNYSTTKKLRMEESMKGNKKLGALMYKLKFAIKLQTMDYTDYNSNFY